MNNMNMNNMNMNNMSMNNINSNLNLQGRLSLSPSNSTITSNISSTSTKSLSRPPSVQNIVVPNSNGNLQRQSVHFFPPSPPNQTSNFNFPAPSSNYGQNITPTSQSSTNSVSTPQNFGNNYLNNFQNVSPQYQYGNSPIQNQYPSQQQQQFQGNLVQPPITQYGQQAFNSSQGPLFQKSQNFGLSPQNQPVFSQATYGQPTSNQLQYQQTQQNQPSPPVNSDPSSSNNSVAPGSEPTLVRSKSKFSGLFRKKSVSIKDPSTSSSNSVTSIPNSTPTPLSKATKFSSIKINESDISKITEMGYSRDIAISTLAQCKGDLSTAINTLVGNN